MLIIGNGFYSEQPRYEKRTGPSFDGSLILWTGGKIGAMVLPGIRMYG